MREAGRPDGGPQADLLEAAPDAMIGVDDDGLIRFANRQVEVLFGYARSELVGRPIEMLVPEAQRAAHVAHRSRFVRSPGVRPMGAGIDLSARRKDGSTFPVDIALSAVPGPEEGGQLVIAAVRDMTHRRAEEMALRQATERFQAVFENAPIGMALVELDGHPLLVNTAMCRLLGHSRRTLMDPGSPLVDPAALGIDEAGLDLLVSGRERIRREERPHRRPDGRSFWLARTASVLVDADDRPASLLLQVEDVTTARAAVAELAHQALYDPLTSLANRTLVLDHLGQALARSRRSGTEIAVLFVDLDHFKEVNDTLGHDVGDRLLVEVAERLRRLLRAGDTAGRLSGDEFVLVCEEVAGAAEALRIARRVLRDLTHPCTIDGHEVRVAASVGIALASGGSSTPESLLRESDMAMYRAKELGRGRCELFDPGMRKRTMGRLVIEADLRTDVERKGLSLVYQPQLLLPSGRLAVLEALVRWQHPVRGPVEPSEFIPVAEDSGLILPIGDWVLRHACRAAAGWPDAAVGLSVNVSGRQLADPGLTGLVAATLEASGLAPARLWLDVAETALERAGERAERTLSALRLLGVHLCMDDFGTGSASLRSVTRFRPDAIKVDRSVIAALGVGGEAEAILAAAVSVAHSLGASAVAEGVETPDQRRAVEAGACDAAQGFLLGRPLAAAGVASLFDATFS